MSPATWDAGDLAEHVRVECDRLAATRGEARWAAEAWWVRRVVVTTVRWPGSMQHALAAAVVASIPRSQLEAHLRTSAPRRDTAV